MSILRARPRGGFNRYASSGPISPRTLRGALGIVGGPSILWIVHTISRENGLSEATPSVPSKPNANVIGGAVIRDRSNRQ